MVEAAAPILPMWLAIVVPLAAPAVAPIVVPLAPLAMYLGLVM